MPHLSPSYPGGLSPADVVRLRDLRRDIHAHPETAFNEIRTAHRIAQYLTEIGAEVTTGVGGTGVVARIHGRTPGPTVALRADMDALPILEAINRPHASRRPGVMHACGHDGHIAMLLGAGHLLIADDSFAGTVALIFQPAEEEAAGAQTMLDDGVIERFGIVEIYGIHNIPGIPAGDLAIRDGVQLASLDHLSITVTALGGHAMAPHLTGDVVTAGSYLVTALQTVVSRRLDPQIPAVLSITSFHAGSTGNVLPARAELQGTVRCLSAETRDHLERIVNDVCQSVAQTHGVNVDLRYERRYPATVNATDGFARAVAAATSVVGSARVDSNCRGILAAEDFSFFLQRLPGAYMFIGNGEVAAESGPVHSPTYDFNDEIIATGAAYLSAVARSALADRATAVHR